ncbi:hypothetical protein HK096_003344 [Nowakowskiella sp. JEL0078]|nr:hypothetical protein HK096_003344 [Nowakowskiella sp. JEL0078]
MSTEPKKYETSVHEELPVYDDGKIQEAHKRVIAIAIEDSKHSEYAFNFLVDNIVHKGDQVVLLNVRPYPEIPSVVLTGMYVDIDWEQKVDEDQRNCSHELLQKFGGQLVKLGISTRAIALRGDPREEIVKKAKELDATLLVIGSRGLGLFKRTMLGSVSDYVVHHAHCAMQEIAHREERIIFIAVDKSKHSENAFKYYIENVMRSGDKVILLNVRPFAIIPSARITGISFAEEWEEILDVEDKSNSQTLLQNFEEEVLKLGLECSVIALQGDPREEILNQIAKINPSLLIVGSRGLGSFKSTVIGSVSDYLVHHASCPYYNSMAALEAPTPGKIDIPLSVPVVLRISIPLLSLQKALRATTTDLIWNLKLQILEKVAQDIKDALNYGVYFPSKDGKPGKFLEEKRELGYYSLENNVSFTKFLALIL